MTVKYGHTTITCRNCGKKTDIDNRQLTSADFSYICPSCGMAMSIYERAHLMMHYNYLMYQKVHEILGNQEQQFDYEIMLFPHVEKEDLSPLGNGDTH